MKLVTKLFIILDVIIVFCFLLVYGPISKARVFWITTAMETGSHQYFAYIFYSKNTVNKVMSENKLEEINEETDASSIKIGEVNTNYTSVYEKEILEHNDNDLYKLIEFKYGEFDCYLVAIYDPKRVEVAYSKNLGSGEVLSDIALRENAIVAINGGGFKDYMYDNTGGVPTGITVSNGNVAYDDYSNKNFIGLTKDNKLILIKNATISDIKNNNIILSKSSNFVDKFTILY